MMDYDVGFAVGFFFGAALFALGLWVGGVL